MHTLFIEENAQDYLQIRRILDEEKNPLNIDWAPNYDIALKQIKKKRYDIYLVGYKAQQVQQRQILTWLSKYTIIPIILLTKHNESVDPALMEKTQVEVLPKEQLTWFLFRQTLRYLSQLIILQKKESIFQNTFNKALEIMVLLKPNGALQEFNQKALTLIGDNGDTMKGQLFWEMPFATHSQQTQADIKAAVATAAQGNFARCEVEIQKNDEQLSTLVFLLNPITHLQNKVVRILVEGHQSDAQNLELHSSVKNLDGELNNQRDQLTGLPNRHIFIEMVDKAISRARQEKNYHIAVLFLELERIKIINISLGHDMGDWLLMGIAERLQDCLGENDVLARSGSEFMILLEMQDLSEATQLATIINKQLTGPFSLGEYEVITLASIGIAYYENQEEATDLLRDANIAMAHAKVVCKSCYIVFNHEMHEKALSRLQIETNIHQAIKRNDFILFYQPQVDLYSKKLIATEALIRFRHSQDHFILPGEFLPILEDTGFIISLGEWILQTACSQLKTWLNAGLLIERITVNLSAHQFRSKHLVHVVTEAIEKSGLSPENLELELTKNLLLEEKESIIKTLKTFKDMGIRITLDDFGVGYGSLDYLKLFPVDCIKIDNSFIQGVISSPEDAAITVSTIDIAHALGLIVVAEGVETPDQRDFLRDHGCDFAQGYLYAAPMESPVFLEWGKQYCQMVNAK